MQDIKCISDKSFFLQKKKIQEYIFQQYQEVAEHYSRSLICTHILQSQQQKNESKIYRGENFLGTPYYVLDLPKIQSRHDIFLLRLHTWWGEYFSISLLLSGSYYHQLHPHLSHPILQAGYQVSDRDLWLFDYRESDTTALHASDSIKYFHLYPLSDLEQLATIGIAAIDQLVHILDSSTRSLAT